MLKMLLNTQYSDIKQLIHPESGTCVNQANIVRNIKSESYPTFMKTCNPHFLTSQAATVKSETISDPVNVVGFLSLIHI